MGRRTLENVERARQDQKYASGQGRPEGHGQCAKRVGRGDHLILSQVS